MRMLRYGFGFSQMSIVVAATLLSFISSGARSFLVPHYQPVPNTGSRAACDGLLSSFASPTNLPSRSICATCTWRPIKVPRQQTASAAAKRALHQQAQDDDQHKKSSKRRALVRRGKALIRRVKRPLIPVVGSLMFWWAARTAPAEAKMSHEVSQTPTYSLRPGMSATDMDDVVAGKADIKAHDPTSTAATSPAPAPKKSLSKSIYGDDFEDEDDFDLDDDEDEAFGSRSKSATQADLARSKSMQASQSSQFATYRKEKTSMMYVKVCAGVFLPTFGTMFMREHFRQRKEEAYVQKGLEILEAQKAEYFNVTSTSENSDLEDELKDLKNNSTDTDEDDDDSDDEDDDDDENVGRGRRPKRPRGGGDGDEGGSGGVSGEGEGVSDEDRDRLKNLFDKS